MRAHMRQTRTPPAVRQTRARTHTHTQAQSRTRACAHTRPRSKAHFVSVRTRACAHMQTRAHANNTLASSQIRTQHVCVWVCAHLHTHTDIMIRHARARACAQTRTRTKIHARTRTVRRRNTPLHFAADKGHADVVAALLAHGADVHARKFGR